MMNRPGFPENLFREESWLGWQGAMHMKTLLVWMRWNRRWELLPETASGTLQRWTSATTPAPWREEVVDATP
jgi:hypothetical protein